MPELTDAEFSALMERMAALVDAGELSEESDEDVEDDEDG